MGNPKWADKRFGQRVRAEREGRRWSQAYMAKMLSANGIQPMHPTTIAKIEAGDRSVRINEAVGIADLFEVPLDVLLGRQRVPDDTTLTFAMTTLLGYIHDADGQILEAQRTAADIEEQLEDAGDRFDSPRIKVLRRAARDMAGHLDKAQALATEIVHTASHVIVDAGEEK